MASHIVVDVVPSAANSIYSAHSPVIWRHEMRKT